MVTTCSSLFLGEQNWAGVAGERCGVPPVPQFGITSLYGQRREMDASTKVSPLLAEAAEAGRAVAEQVASGAARDVSMPGRR